MTSDILKELKRIRAASHQRSIQATENDLSRLIAHIERGEDELNREWEQIMRTGKLPFGDMTIELISD